MIKNKKRFEEIITIIETNQSLLIWARYYL